MAHKILDSGAVYEITGGKVMDAGTVYGIDHGNVMDAGTVYEIPFGSKIDGTQKACVLTQSGAYFNTEYKPNGNTRVVMDCTLNGGPTLPTYLGAWDAANSNMFVLLYNTSGQWWCMYGDQIGIYNGATKNRTVFDANKNVWKGGTITLATMTASNFQTNYPLFLSAYNNGGTADNISTVYIYSCQIYDNGTLVRDYVPWQRASGEIGLYDQVNAKFYPNAGEGSLLVY